MNDFLNKLERKVGKHTVPHLTAIMIGLMAMGYVMSAINAGALSYFTLNPERIFHGQVWRIVTWVLVPRNNLDIFTVIMLFFYFSIGVSLEKAWGDFRYNAYIFSGLILTIIAAIVSYFIYMPFFPDVIVGQAIGTFFSPYYICMSILLAYAATFPEAVVLLFFIIPLKMKYFGVIELAFLLYEVIGYIRIAAQGGQLGPLYILPIIAIAVSLLNFALFFSALRNRVHLTAEQRKRQKEFRRQVLEADARNKAKTRQKSEAGAGGATVVSIASRHRCEVCGRTEITDPDLEFRYCSKCMGAHEYCMDHLYTHEHIRIAPPGGDNPAAEGAGRQSTMNGEKGNL